jgi:hypothetical protein
MAKRVLVLADIHGGSTVAPCLPGQELQDGATYYPNKYQEYLNECWADMLAMARKWKPDTIVLLGDLIQGGDPRKDMQQVSPLHSIHCSITYRLLEPLTKIKGVTWYAIRGTEWHDGRSSDDVAGLAKTLGCKPNASTGSPTWRRVYLQMGGRLVDFMHHVSVTSIRQYAATAVLRDSMNHKLELFTKFPELPPLGALVRAHAHIGLAVQGDDVWGVRCPGWQMGTAYTDAKGNAILSDIGYTLLWLDEDNKIQVKVKRYDLPRPHIEGEE